MTQSHAAVGTAHAPVAVSDLAVSRLPTERKQDLMEYYAQRLRDPKAKSYFTWRDALGMNDPVVALLGGRIVGTVNITRCCLAGGGRTFEGGFQQDSIVDSNLRGQGIGGRLIDLAADGYKIVLAKGTSPAMYGLRKKRGFADVPRATYLAKALRPWQTKGRLTRRVAQPLLYLHGAIRASFVDFPNHIQIRRTNTFGATYDRLADELKTLPVLGIMKDCRYLIWRYLQCPERRYLILEAVDGHGSPEGAVILRPPETVGGSAWLVDLVAHPKRPAVITALIRSAVHEARTGGAATLFAFATARVFRKAMKQLGFVDIRESPRFTYRAEGDWSAWESSTVEWNFWHGDGDTELY